MGQAKLAQMGQFYVAVYIDDGQPERISGVTGNGAIAAQGGVAASLAVGRTHASLLPNPDAVMVALW